MAANQPTTNDLSNANVRGENSIRNTWVGKEEVCVTGIWRDLIGGQRGSFKSFGKRWLPNSPVSMTGQIQMFEEKMA